MIWYTTSSDGGTDDGMPSGGVSNYEKDCNPKYGSSPEPQCFALPLAIPIGLFLALFGAAVSTVGIDGLTSGCGGVCR